MTITLSCSVKEDREPCPCWLNIDLRQCGSVHDNRLGQDLTFSAMDVVVSAWNDSFLFQQKVDHEDYGQLCEKTVPKSYVSTSVVYGEEKMIRDGYKLIIPTGDDADEIWAHAGNVACFYEFALDTAVLHKQFARIRVKIANPIEEKYPYTFRLRGDIYGLDLRDLTPLEGKIDMELQRGKDDIIDFNLIRQKQDSKIEIDVYEKAKLIDTFPINEWIRELNYSWLAKDLKDINMNIDYAKGEIFIKVNDWGDGGSIKIEI